MGRIRKKTPSYQGAFLAMYQLLGFPLSRKSAVAASELDKAEKRLGVTFPRVLRDYYLVAGRESRFNQAYNHLLAPKDCFVDQRHLVFMEENQAAVYWGVPVSETAQDDPPAAQGVNGDTVAWYQEADRCSEFLNVMLCWQGAFGGGMPVCATAVVPAEFEQSLGSKWKRIGENNGMRAYLQPERVLCFLEWESDWRIFAGATTAEGLADVARMCGVSWTP